MIRHEAKKTAVSVVMAVYNGEKYLKEQLDSIAAQSVPADEIVIRDDGSSDRSLSVIRAWMKSHPDVPVRLIEGKENLGYIGNFRNLLEQCRTDWVFLCDQDDRWHENKIETMLGAAENRPEISLLASSFSFMNSASENYTVPLRPGWSNNNLIPWAVENPGGLNEISFERLLEHNYFQGAAMMVRNDVIAKYLESENVTLAHDWFLAMIAAMDQGLYYLDQSLFDYRIHEQNVTGLPQAKGRSKIRTLKTWMNRYYRTVVVEDMVRVLKTLQENFPSRFGKSEQQRLDFCLNYLQTLDQKRLGDYLRLAAHPGRKACMSKKEFLVGAVFIAASKVWKMPDGKI